MAVSKDANRTSVCRFCGKGFSNEKILVAHMCVRKKRFADRNVASSQLGFRVFQRFYELTTRSKTPKTVDEFIGSQYYIAFVKFARSLIERDTLCASEFIDYIISNGIKLSSWPDDHIYEDFLRSLLKREPPENALERSVLTMNDWCTENNMHLTDFFDNVSTYDAVELIRNARISPWVLYLADSASGLFVRFSPEQFSIIETIIEPSVWQKKISKRSDDITFVVGILESAGL